MTDSELTVRDSMTVQELEEYFDEKFGLSIQILRKSGNLWLDTARTNTWTLKEQDDHGREISPVDMNFNDNLGKNGFRKNLG